MGPAFYVMAILGCGESADVCQPVTTDAVRYESAAECNAATETALQKHTDILFPVVVAECRAAGTPLSQKVWSDEIKLPDPQQRQRIQRASYRTASARS